MENNWSNEARLETLKAGLEKDKLIFEAAGERAEVYLRGGDISKVVFSLLGQPAVTINPDAAQALVVGEGNAQRDVYHYLRPGGPAPTMRLGITKHRGEGTWSSLPHDFELNTEPGFEEVFFYILKGKTARGIQVGKGVWFDNSPVDAVWPIRHETFGTVPMGYHPVVGEPGVHVSYVWVYLAKKKAWEKLK
jgi:5-deoxy-D-glucuronate isomerase